MTKAAKLVLDSIGVLISLVGFALLVAQEMYVVSGLLLLVLIGLVLLLYRHSSSRPYRILNVKYTYKFKDANADEVLVRKKVDLIPLEKNISKLDDIGIGATGGVSDINVVNGNVSMRDEGGSVSTTTTFSAPLTIGEIYVHEVDYVGRKSFPKSRESVFHTVIHNIENACIQIQFHKDRTPSKITALQRLGSNSKDITRETLTRDGELCCFTIDKPKRGSVFTINWDW